MMKNLKQSLSVAVATLGILGITSTNPALAALFKLGFCGQFLNLDDSPILPDDPFKDPDAVNKVLPSYIMVESTEVDDPLVNFGIKSANIQTQRVDDTIPIITYDFDNLVSASSDGVDVTWQFDNGGNVFDLIVPELILNDLENLVGDDLRIINFEDRVNLDPVKDPDDLVITPVPEPTSILGTAIALGLGGLLTKRNLKKLNDNN